MIRPPPRVAAGRQTRYGERDGHRDQIAARSGDHAPIQLVRRSSGVRARAGADLRPRLAVRGADRLGCRAGPVPHLPGRPRAGCRGARPRRRVERLRQHLPAPGDGGCRDGAGGRRSSVLTTPGRTASTAACGRRLGHSWSLSSIAPSSVCCRWRWTSGGRSCSSTATSTRRLCATCWGACRRCSRVATSASTVCVSESGASRCWRRTGRPWSRTSSSATTARRRIPDSRR